MVRSSLNFEDINRFYRSCEEKLVPVLLAQLDITERQKENIQIQARFLIEKVRAQAHSVPLIDQVMRQFPLSAPEGVLLMCLCEALLRIPDMNTRISLLRDKLSQADFRKYLKSTSSWIMTLTTKSFALSRELFQKNEEDSYLKNAIEKISLPALEKIMNHSMKLFTGKFVLGSNIEGALKASLKNRKKGYTHSFDMLGEAAFTQSDADRYFEDYLHAIHAIAQHSSKKEELSGNGISIKLSALHPRYSFAQQDRVMKELADRLLSLCQAAFERNIPLTIDAEESERLELSLKLIEKVAFHPSLKDWQGLGLAVQAYQKRAGKVIEFIADIAERSKKRFNVRLVKGAYWDSEIKRCQELGLPDYPVFTRKESTDLSYLVCAQQLLACRSLIFPQFATHNALTITTIKELAGQDPTSYEFQKLYGMGDELYEVLMTNEQNLQCRIYAPVGEERELLPYLVRRLLENGANSSFINHLMDPDYPIDKLVQLPQDNLNHFSSIRHEKIPLPKDLYGSERQNSRGIDLTNTQDLAPLLKALQDFSNWQAYPLVGGRAHEGISYVIYNPAIDKQEIGKVQEAPVSLVQEALECAEHAFTSWNLTSASIRALSIHKFADLLEDNREELITLCVKEGGKTLPDAIAELREAVDFCRYYAKRGEKDFGVPVNLVGPTGEKNDLLLQGRGVFVCISPWNFPLAIFVGQVVAALMAGNAVIAKPARQTPLVAFRACQLLHKAGIPLEVLQYLPGSGSDLGPILMKDPRVSGVAFTGSTQTACSINRMLASREGSIATLIAETGGQNAMIVDSSALPEQVVMDILSSAFQSAGQRCSALRVAFIQEEIAPRVIEILKGAMAELKVGDPSLIETDIGPVIDEKAKESLESYRTQLKAGGHLIYECQQEKNMGKGSFVPPSVFELASLDSLKEEVFGPILHIIRFKSQDLEKVISQINKLGYGLTFGLHTRLDSRIHDIAVRLRVGNVYVNRNMIGAVVGVQPFGGQGLSGTGPKAGGPHYLYRFSTEKTISINTTAQGGNTSLLAIAH
jgi:RHH-type proline utilization regulon transcriptional repressor/proline dehydrogenase/delta 1-pyrroline-5-carboxylate dehydrogenase